MIPQFNSIVLDVVVVVLMLTIIAIGAFKGIKHIAINFGLLLVSFALSLSSLTNVVKKPIVDLLSSNIVFGAGVGDETKLATALLYNLLAALILAILLYVVLRLIKFIIVMIMKRQKAKRNELMSSPGKVSRITGALFSLVFNGVLFVLLLSIFAMPLVGGNKTLESGYVAKHVEKLDDLVIESLTDEGDLIKEKVIIKLLHGDVLFKVGLEDASAMKMILELVENGKLVPEDLNEPQKQIDYLHSVLTFLKSHALDENGLEVDGFEKMVEISRNIISKSINQMNTLHGSAAPIEAKNTLAVANLLKDVGLKETVAIFESIFVIA